MGITELFLIAVGLSMDAFAVALCKGLNMKKMNYKSGFIISLFFGGFQAFMPFLGWLLGIQFEQYIKEIDHWIAFALLAFIGGKMILETAKEEEEEIEAGLDVKELVVLSLATSIDALAVGITFAFLNVNIVPSVLLIGVITFVLSFVGVTVGNHFGMKLKKKAELAGGIILIMIGLKILLEHLGILVL